MRKFGIIAEGVTDQIVIENILLGYFDESGLDNDDIGYEQPLLDETDLKRAPEAAGWGMVFKYFELSKFKAAFQFYERLIVQMDTDVSEQKGYDVPWREGGRELTPEELIVRVVSDREVAHCRGPRAVWRPLHLRDHCAWNRVLAASPLSRQQEGGEDHRVPQIR